MINYFISDLHLEDGRPDITAIFLKFLQEAVTNAEALYILGDFFEVWIGDDDLTAFNLSVISALHAATDAGLKIYFMPGNRDFLIGKIFLRMTGCKLLPDEYVLKTPEFSILLMHGDTLCTADIKYLKFRKKSRNWLMQKIFLLKKLTTRQLIAANMRANSRIHTSTAPDYIMDVTQSEVEHLMRKHNVKHLIHGHTHRAESHHFEIDGQAATRIVLAPWHERGCVLKYDEDGNCKIEVLESV
jgi:UDP-2,3-diacylglucosamine hydrolase